MTTAQFHSLVQLILRDTYRVPRQTIDEIATPDAIELERRYIADKHDAAHVAIKLLGRVSA